MLLCNIGCFVILWITLLQSGSGSMQDWDTDIMVAPCDRQLRHFQRYIIECNCTENLKWSAHHVLAISHLKNGNFLTYEDLAFVLRSTDRANGTIKIDGAINAGAMAVDNAINMVFYTTIAPKTTIAKMKINVWKVTTLAILTWWKHRLNQNRRGMAIDPARNKVYVCTKGSLAMVNYDGSGFRDIQFGTDFGAVTLVRPGLLYANDADWIYSIEEGQSRRVCVYDGFINQMFYLGGNIYALRDEKKLSVGEVSEGRCSFRDLRSWDYNVQIGLMPSDL